MEYCSKCLENKCSYHKWFIDSKLKNEEEILIAELKYILEYKIIARVVEKVYLVENHLDYTESMNIIDFIHGNLNFTINTPPSAKKDEYYIPLISYNVKEDIISHNIEINIDIIRHNPMSIKITKNKFGEVMHDIQLIDSNDYLHMESIDDYYEIVKLAESRLNNFITKIDNEFENKRLKKY